jgi:striatin 1/3/4
MSTNTDYNWSGVIQFLQDSQKKQLEKETEWLIEKEELKSENERLKGQLGAQENINMDLLKRIKMLEYCLRAER